MVYRAAASAALALFSLLLLSTAQARAQDGSCTRVRGFYEAEAYTVRRVRVDSPLGWLPSVGAELNELASHLAVKEGRPYRKSDEFVGFESLQNNFPELKVSRELRFAVRVAWPALENCDERAKTLDVIYHVYTIGGPSNYTGRIFEGGNEQVRRSAVETPATRRLAAYMPRPFVAYNRTRGIYAGTDLSFKPSGGLFDKLDLEGSGSSSSSEARLDASGSRDFDAGEISHASWSLGYIHSDVPTASSARLKEERLRAQFFAATRAAGRSQLVMRFGASVEGGHMQADEGSGILLPGDVADSGYGALKTFAGATMRAGRHAFKASYGLQLGGADGGRRLDYVKQVFDTAADFRFLVREHRTITLDAQFTAGAIKALGPVPLAEKFFGGNVEENFIDGSDWVIRSDPFIRSFPQRRLAQVNSSGTLGGDRFFSANLTVAANLWGRPLVPAVVSDDPGFGDAVETAMSGVESILFNSYLVETPEFRSIVEQLKPGSGGQTKALPELLSDVGAELDRLSGLNTDSDVSDEIVESRVELNTASRTVGKIVKDLDADKPQTSDVRKLVAGFPDLTPPTASYLEALEQELTKLKEMPRVPQPNTLPVLIESLSERRKSIAEQFLSLTKGPVSQSLTRRAEGETEYTRRVIDQLVHEVNLISVSPVAIFDAARIRQRSFPGDGGVRYALGGGLRLSIVSLDLTAGYAWNPKRKPWEGRGAFIFTFDVTDLFR